MEGGRQNPAGLKTLRSSGPAGATEGCETHDEDGVVVATREERSR